MTIFMSRINPPRLRDAYILTGCEEFVDTMNAVIHRYKVMISQQHGHHHGTGTTGGGVVIHPVGGEEGGD